MTHVPLTPRQRRWRRIGLLAKGTIAVLVIGMALVVGSAGLALPWVVAHPHQVQDFLSARMGRAVTIGSLTGEWTVVGPVFQLRDVQIERPDGSGEPFSIDSAELAIDFYASLKSGVSFSEFRLLGLDLDLVLRGDGGLQVARLGRAKAGAAGNVAGLDALLDLGSLNLRQARVTLRDAASGRTLALERMDLRYASERGARRIGGLAWARAGAAPLRFACELQGMALHRCYLAGDGIALAEWFAAWPLAGIAPVSGTVDLRAWVDLDDGPAAVRVELATHALALRGSVPIGFSSGDSIEPRASFDAGKISLAWRRADAGWHLALDERGERGRETRVSLVAAGAASARSYTLEAQRIDLGRWAAPLALAGFLPERLRAPLYETSPRGALERVVAARAADGTWSLSARVAGLSLQPARKTPGFGPLSGTLLADEAATVWVLDANQSLQLDFPHVFMAPIEANLANATIGAARTPEGLRIEASGLDFAGDGFAARARVALTLDPAGSKPHLDAAIAIGAGQLTAAKRFWPINVMRKTTRDWLDRGLLGGQMASGEAVVFGDLDDWPFHQAQGRFEAGADFAAVDLDYHPRWPAARIGHLRADFVNDGMQVRADDGQVLGVAATTALATIAHFRDPVLNLAVEGAGSGPELLRFLRESPIRDTAGAYLVGLDIGGSATLGFELVLPLGADAGEARLAGVADLDDADLSSSTWDLALGRAKGRVRFSNKGFVADDLAVILERDPASFAIASGEFVVDPAHALEASLRGEFPVSSVLRGFPELALLVPLMPGRAYWDTGLTVPRSADARARLSVASDLRGLEVMLPAPLHKQAAEARELQVVVDVPARGGALAIKYGAIVDSQARLEGPGATLAVALGFGAAPLPALPAAGFVLRGDLPTLDLESWLALGGAGVGAGMPAELDLRIGDLVAWSRRFGAMHVAGRSDAQGTELTLDGAAAVGRIEVPPGARLGVSAQFERLYLPESTSDAPPTAIHPGRLPPIHFWARDARLGPAELGEIRIETYPQGDGMHLERIEANSPNLELRGRGDWVVEDGVQHTTMDVTFTAESLGRMLDTLGFVGLVEGGQTFARVQGRWAGTPSQFGLARMQGELELKVGHGRIVQVDPGAGRLFGLLNLSEVPRRLALDFSDLFQSGLSFDAVEGKFSLRGGSAYTTDLLMRGPSADILVSGRTGLADRDYDQELVVKPRLGGVLPVVGALAAGPVGVAAGLVAQGVLKNPIDRMGAARYRVTGSWENPDIEQLARLPAVPVPRG
jgi:uncharacterized protein (TIGR02099 family)